MPGFRHPPHPRPPRASVRVLRETRLVRPARSTGRTFAAAGRTQAQDPVCLISTGAFRGVCKKIDHFPEDADYEQDTAEYLLRKSPSPGLPGGEGVRGGCPALAQPPLSLRLLRPSTPRTRV